MVLDNNYHSVFSLNYLLVISTFEKNEVLTSDVLDKVKEMFIQISKNHKVELMRFEGFQFYIKIEFKTNPNMELSKFINAYKSATSRVIKNVFPELKQKVGDKKFWNESYLLVSQSTVDVETEIKKFLTNL